MHGGIITVIPFTPHFSLILLHFLLSFLCRALRLCQGLPWALVLGMWARQILLARQRFEVQRQWRLCLSTFFARAPVTLVFADFPSATSFTRHISCVDEFRKEPFMLCVQIPKISNEYCHHDVLTISDLVQSIRTHLILWTS